MYQLGTVLRDRGDYERARQLFQQALAIQRRTLVYGLALVLLDRGEYAEAEALLLESKAIRERGYGAGSAPTALIVSALAGLARERHDYTLADSLLQGALHSLKAAGYTDLQEDVQHIHRELVVLHETWGKPERAAQHRRLLIIRPE